MRRLVSISSAGRADLEVFGLTSWTSGGVGRATDSYCCRLTLRGSSCGDVGLAPPAGIKHRQVAIAVHIQIHSLFL